jgi:hypothetical protein
MFTYETELALSVLKGIPDNVSYYSVLKEADRIAWIRERRRTTNLNAYKESKSLDAVRAWKRGSYIRLVNRRSIRGRQHWVAPSTFKSHVPGVHFIINAGGLTAFN